MMKSCKKALLALALTITMLCGMLTPAFAWIPEQTSLRSPDGVYWFDMAESRYWPSARDYDGTMIYSQDGVVWFSEEGMLYYTDLSYWPDETWQQHMLDSAVDETFFYTTDYGKMWIRFENGVIDASDWIDWLDVWPPETINLHDASQYLYRNDDSFVMCTEPLDDNSYRIGILDAGINPLGKYVSEVRFNVVPSGAGDHLLLSTDGENWASSIPVSAWKNTDNYVKNLLGAGISFDPYTGVAYQYAETYNGQFSLRRAADAGDCPALVQRTLYLRADSDCSVSLELTCDNTTRCTYGMMSLQSIPAEDREISQNASLAGLPESAGSMLIVGEAEDALPSYTPIDIPEGTTVSFTDANNNYVFDSADECSGSLTLAPYTVQAQSSGEATLRLRSGCTYSIPFWFWMEGQDADAGPDSAAFHNSDAWFNLQIRYSEEEPEHVHTYNGMPVWTFADNFSSATATFTCKTCGETYTCEADLEVTVVEEATCTMDRIINYTVTAVLNGRTYSETYNNYIMLETATGHSWSETPVAIGENYHGIVCKNCGEVKENSEGLHTFDGVTIYPTCQHGGKTTVTCQDCGYSYITDEKPVTDHNFLLFITYPTCETAGRQYARCSYCGLVEDTVLPPTGHNYGDWVVTTPATTSSEGEETRVCTRCQAAETRAIDRLPAEPRFVVSDGSAHPGETVQLTVSISDNPGVVSVMLRLQYDPQVLTLTAVDNGDVFDDGVFQSGGNLSAVPFTVFWADSLAEQNNTANGSLVTFTFSVAADAPVGTTPVTITYEQASTLDVDLDRVPFNVENGSVNVTLRMAGDADGDGEVTLQDVVNLTRYLAGGWDADVDVSNADVDGDGMLTLRDVILLRRYIAGGWGVELI